MIKTFNTEQLAATLGIKKTSFDGNRRYYEKKLLENGYAFTVTGRTHRDYHFELEEEEVISLAKHHTKLQWDRNNTNIGVYKISCKETGELLYIGSTLKGFGERWTLHTYGINNDSKANQTNKVVREYAAKGFTIVFEELYTVLETSEVDVEKIEYYYIQLLKPKGNMRKPCMKQKEINQIEKLI